MTNLRKAAEMALEALNKRINGDFDGSTYTDIEYMASEALRTALAQPEQEPVAWLDSDGLGVEISPALSTLIMK